MGAARACLEADRPADAFLYLRAVENSASHRGEVRRLLGLAHLRAGDIDQAVGELMAAARAHPDDLALAEALEQALEHLTEPISGADYGAAGGDPRRMGTEPADSGAHEGATGIERAIGGSADAGWEPASGVAGPPLPEALLSQLSEAGGFERDLSFAEAASFRELAFVELESDASADRGDSGAPELGAGDSSAPEPDSDERESLEGVEHEVQDVARDALEAEGLATTVESPAPAVEAATGKPGTLEPGASAPQPVAPLVDLGPIRAAIPGSPRQLAAQSRTLLLRGEPRLLRSWPNRTRKALLWTAAVAAALATVSIALAYRSASGTPAALAGRAPVTVSHARTPVPPTPGRRMEEGVPSGTPKVEPRQTKRPAAVPAAVEERPAAAAPPPVEPVTLPDPEPASAPTYAFVARLGLDVPPGAILDPENSDTERLLREDLSKRDAGSAVLTFRTPEPVESVVAFYQARHVGGFHPRLVRMGGKFLGVQRTVARAATRAVGGRQATITVSNPGVDAAGKKLVPETTVRILLF